MKRIITAYSSASTVSLKKSVRDAIRSIDGPSVMGHLVQLADAAGYEMDVDDLYEIDVVAKVGEDAIWMPSIDVTTRVLGNKLQFNVVCKFPELNSDESYHIQHWMEQWSKVADLVEALTRYKIDLLPHM